MMAISYPLRLACLIAVSMGLLQVGIEVLLWMAAPGILRLVRSVTVRQRERALYTIQLLPFAGALLSTALFIVPQYVSNETNFSPEGVGWICLLLAAAVSLWWVARAFGGVRMAVKTMLFSRACRRGDELMTTVQGATPIVLVDGATTVAGTMRVGLVGLMRPFIFLSKSLVGDGGLTAPALEVVLDHERSHAAERDNWKLLSLHCLPRLGLRLPGGKTWMGLWQSAAEWAADEDAVQGNSARALLLAESLVALARSASGRPPQIACTYFVREDNELALRVERLIERRQDGASLQRYRVAIAVCVACVAIVAGAAILVGSQASALRELPERLLHLG